MLFDRWLVAVRGGRLRQTRPDNCCQTVIAQALGLPIAVVEEVAATTGTMTVDETIAVLGRLGVYCRPLAAGFVAEWWPIFYRQNGGRKLRGLGFALPKDPTRPGHAYYLSGATMYDPATGASAPLTEHSLRTLDWLALLPEDAVATVGGPRLG